VPDHSEQELLARARRGDRGAFDRLHRELEAPVRRFLYRLVGPIPSGEEIVQDAFVALFQNLKRIQQTEGLRPFLFRVIRNLCYDELKRRGRFQVVSWDQETAKPGAALRNLKDQRPLPDEAVHWKRIYEDVQAAMDRLPELQRQTMILYGEEDLSYAQIAEAMGTDIGTVKSRLHHARRNLIKNLKPEVREALDLDKKAKRPDSQGETK
jgi:RNA polymerase sigma-70 factor (ECF subfamily)